MKNRAIQLIDDNDAGTVGDMKVSLVHDDAGKILSGFVIGDTLYQNMAMLLMGNPGENKQFPTLGVGLPDSLLSEDLLEFRHKIRKEFPKDGLKILELEMYDLNNIKINATY